MSKEVALAIADWPTIWVMMPPVEMSSLPDPGHRLAHRLSYTQPLGDSRRRRPRNPWSARLAHLVHE
jgi:hypothetical protein